MSESKVIFVSMAQENRQNPALESFETVQKQEIGQNPALEIQNSVGGRGGLRVRGAEFEFRTKKGQRLG